MKNYNLGINQLCIGETINEFDNLPDGKNTVQMLNEMFNTRIKLEGLVVIGKPLPGDTRELTIDGKEYVTTMYHTKETGLIPYLGGAKKHYGRWN